MKKKKKRKKEEKQKEIEYEIKMEKKLEQDLKELEKEKNEELNRISSHNQINRKISLTKKDENINEINYQKSNFNSNDSFKNNKKEIKIDNNNSENKNVLKTYSK